MIRKLKTIEIERLSVEQFHEAQKMPLIVVLDDVRSLHNVGSVFRTADAFALQAVYLCGITAQPPMPEIHKTALGAEDSVEWHYFATTEEAVEQLHRDGYFVYAIEQCEGSTMLQNTDFRNDPHERYAVIMGNEVKGVKQSVIDMCDACLEIPQFGTKHSMNVSVTAGIVMWEFARQLLLSFLLLLLPLTALAQDFVLGTDMGWLTEYEAQGKKFYDNAGNEREAMSLMADYGVTAQRIRVWVDPSKHGNWCGAADVLNKCLRAKALGQDIMIDFHYSDWWADPAKQNIPASWAGHSYKRMKRDLANHTREILTMLREHDITPRWVQVGNEISNGMLWSVATDPVTGWEIKDANGNTTITYSMGHLERNPKQYAGFFRAGYEAVKEVFPEAIVIVHLDNGFDNDLYNRNLDTLLKYGARFDMIGMSIYPYWSIQSGKEPDAATTITDCIDNIRKVSKKYSCDVMITETGFEVDEEHPEVMVEGRDQFRRLIHECRTLTDGHCRGIFYWEPECNPRQYKLGAFTKDGRPTAIMEGLRP